MFSDNRYINKLCKILLLLLLTHSRLGYTAFLSNGFVVTTKYITLSTFDTNRGQCSASHFVSPCKHKIKIFYPAMNNAKISATENANINNSIRNFIATANDWELTKLTNSRLPLSYNVFESGYQDYFSIRFEYKNSQQIKEKVLSLNLGLPEGMPVTADKLIDYTNPQLREKIFAALLPSQAWVKGYALTPESFLRRKIQYYLKKGEIYLVFNPVDPNQQAVELTIPKNFIKVKSRSNYSSSHM